jgi:hypothetical protein
MLTKAQPVGCGKRFQSNRLPTGKAYLGNVRRERLQFRLGIPRHREQFLGTFKDRLGEFLVELRVAASQLSLGHPDGDGIQKVMLRFAESSHEFGYPGILLEQACLRCLFASRHQVTA